VPNVDHLHCILHAICMSPIHKLPAADSPSAQGQAQPQDDLRPTVSAQPLPLPATQAPGYVRMPSEDLLKGARMLEIEHQGEVYRLQLTRQGKLILTK
jgi:hemin uptake protein HemP